jgi:serine/threonine protein kinase
MHIYPCSKKLGKQRLRDAFLSLQYEFPQESAKWKPVGVGSFGLVVTANDIEKLDPGFVTKFIFRGADPSAEIRNLEAIKDISLPNNLEIPRLIDVQELKNSLEFSHRYTMTKIPGASLTAWNPSITPDTAPAGIMDQIRSAGRALAAFHKAAAQLDLKETPLTPPSWSVEPEIKPVLEFDEKTNAALIHANHYFQENLEKCIIHGDVHSGNILGNDNNQVSGIVDLASMHYGARVKDIMCVPPFFLDIFSDGYSQEYGSELNQDKIILSHLANLTSDQNMRVNETTRQLVLQHTIENLGKVSHITGHTPEF